MGKRWTLILAFVSFISVFGTGILFNASKTGDKIDSVPTAKAQEISPEKTIALIGKGAIINDSVVEQPMVSETNSSQELNVWATAYSSEVNQTDNTPFLTASGTRTRDGVVAANFLPFGTKFMIPSIYGDKVFTVEDRMNAKYNNQRIVDIWMPATKDAIYFGKKTLTIKLL